MDGLSVSPFEIVTLLVGFAVGAIDLGIPLLVGFVVGAFAFGVG